MSSKLFAFYSPIVGSCDCSGREKSRDGTGIPEWKRRLRNAALESARSLYWSFRPGLIVREVGILIIDDDIESQQALRHVLDSEGWSVHVVALASQALTELARGNWSLVIVNVALTDLQGPLFNILKDLAQANYDSTDEEGEEPVEEGQKIRVLFLVPVLAEKEAQPVLEREGLPYITKPYHLHDFLGKISDLLIEAGAITHPIRSEGFGATGPVRRRKRSSRGQRSAMFASREDYQMTEEEIAEFEKAEEEERRKREKEKKEKEFI